MTEYHSIPFNLSPIQKRKCRSALKNHTSVSLRVPHKDMGKGPSHLSLSKRQIESLSRKHASGSGGVVTISHRGLKHSAKHGAGFLTSVLSGGIRLGANALADVVSGAGIKRRRKTGKGLVSSIASSGIRFLGNAIADHVGSGIKKRKHTGKGISDSINAAFPLTEGLAANSRLMNERGYGIKTSRKKKGKGIVSSIASSGIRFLGNALADRIGSGVRRRKVGKGIYSPGE